MKLVTASQMANIDKRAIQEIGIPGLVLMERAGRAVVKALYEILPDVSGRRIVVVCGKGNNGGDGFVVARLLKEKQALVSAFLLASKDEVRGDALANLQKAIAVGVKVQELVDNSQIGTLTHVLERSSGVVDAIFGTGFKGAATGIPALAIEAINSSCKPVIAVDIPSGLSTDTGKAEGPCIKADVTVTFGLPKVGQVFYPGKTLCGRLVIADIGFPKEAVDTEDSTLELFLQEDVVKLLPDRPPDAHKGKFGRIIIIAGSTGMTGAATLSALAATRIGAGLVTVGIPESLNDILEVKLTEAMTKPLPEIRKKRCLALRSLGEIRQLTSKANCLALGPGLSTHRETVELVKRILRTENLPIVVDADGLNALTGEASILKERTGDTVVTPHAGEFSRMTGQPIEAILEDPIRSARDFASEYGLTTVLKGAPTVIATSDGKVCVNSTGNSGMATGGSGDVLTGIIVGLIGQDLSCADAAKLGVFLHGLAGDIAACEKSSMGLIAGDIADSIPKTILSLTSTSNKS